MFAPVPSHDGRRVAVMANRPPDRGIWIIERDRERLLYASAATSMLPIGWAADDGSIYVAEGKIGAPRGATSFVGETMTTAAIVRIFADGGRVERVMAIPAEEVGTVGMTPDARHFVYPVFSNASDVWVVDDFDVPLPAASRLARRRD
jgi:hypothetical protein